MTALSAEVAYDSALTQQLLKKPRTLGDYMEIEKQLRAAAAEVERLTACLQKANANHEHFEREWYLRGDEIERLRAQLEQARAEFTAAVDAEPELPGDMPDEMWLSIRDDRDAATEAMRIVVRQTKCGIKARISERP